MIRVILIPFCVFMLTDFVPYSNVIAVAIFIVASLTDTLMVILQENMNWYRISENLWIRLQISFWSALL